MKSLEINAKNCLISKDQYSIESNGEELHKVVLRNMPEELQDRKTYIGSVSIKIDVIEEDLKIKKSG